MLSYTNSASAHIVAYGVVLLLLALLILPIIIGILAGCDLAIRNLWKAYREALGAE